jgi:hypothetical protein
MEFICKHCEGPATGRPYRVTSEEDGVLMLDMIVCDPCQRQARRLGLHVEKVKLEHMRTKRRLSMVHSGAVARL